MDYTPYIFTAYGLSGTLIAWLVASSWWQARSVDRSLDQAQHPHD